MSIFSKKLLAWDEHQNDRTMPWKGEKDPYKIWLSEVILQQTRVEQGMPYYEKFIHNFPNIQSLADANDQYVFKLWEGLGYYNRCRNLLYTARYIANELNGIFPKQYDQILSLKGIGPYTAAAISSFAYNLPYPVLDGNVFRVLARYFGIDTAIDSTEGKNLFSELAEKELDKKNPAQYNQAIMDFGATVCTPASPKCGDCNMQKNCIAYNNGIVNKLPVKEKTLTKKTRYLTWFILHVNDEIYIHTRKEKDIWQNLNEFYLIETEHKPIWTDFTVMETLNGQFGKNQLKINALSKQIKQQLTHQSILAHIIDCTLSKKPELLKESWIKESETGQYAFPKILKEFLENKCI
ncbi:MAG: A/G-specific adenine glycosylase [Pseudopedobacter saltans]|uniref:Adenine DNA glycosylase n=1 Tax=Pseudopedobacter saltans TaxID=151895 RepID=A0A2W5GZI2_9SPHI|nr:MAG: A/G-specific adenine glycosylase [Pseudopedobacter saltans]